ncbi:MAG: M1 family aminopeptidase [Candidatus Aminicenantales bacterium]
MFLKPRFCYNKTVKGKAVCIVFCFLLSFFSFVFLCNGNERPASDLIAQLQSSFVAKDIPSYLSAFSPEIRSKEESLALSYWNVWKMETISFQKEQETALQQEKQDYFLQVLYENAYSATMEMWRLQIEKVGDLWQIREKEVTGIISNLYKIKIPSVHVERVSSIEIEHADIKLTFKDALLFYDNIPNLEIALIVLGEGHLFYSPSHPVEKHQLELIYKKDALVDRLDYAYLRFSNAFFQSHIQIKKYSKGEGEPVSAADLRKTSVLFEQHYPQSFTMENSFTDELFSFLPQGDQAVFEFNGKKYGGLTYIYSPFDEEEVNLFSRRRNHIINLYSPQKEKEEIRFIISFSQEFLVKYCDLEVDFKPGESYLSVKARVEISSRVDFLTSLKLNFNPALDILRIYDQDGHELFFTMDNLRKILYVYFLRPLSKNQNYSIEIFYRGILKPSPLTADVLQGAFFGGRGDKTRMVFESHLFSHSAYWYPSSTTENYFQARLKVIIPPEFNCISNGELVEQGKLDEIRRVTALEKMGSSFFIFETKYPVKYLAFLVGRLNKQKEVVSDLPVRLYMSPDILGSRIWILEEAQQILQFYENRFGPFPYEKLDVVIRSWNTGGGHSPASFIVINELPQRTENGIFLNPDSPVNLTRWREYFIAHEIAHQWWGQTVTWRSYHDIWLSEGLAQFSTILYLKEKFGDKAYEKVLKRFSRWAKKKSKYGPISLGSRLSYLNFEAFQALIYDKTALILNMLQEIIGKEAFFKGMRDFFDTYKYHSASTRDFLRIMEKNSGQDLKAFFKGWFNSHSLPEVKITHSLLKEKDGYVLKFHLTQINDVFVFPLSLQWMETGTEVRHTVVVKKKDEEFEFHINEKPAKIRINPDQVVPGRFY